MTIRSTVLVGTTLISILLAGPASAAGALLSDDVTLLAGPGPSFGSVGHLSTKTKVGLLWCGPEKFDWCLVTYHKLGGWVHTADLLLLGPNGEIIPGGSFGLASRLGGNAGDPGLSARANDPASGGLDAGGVGSSRSGAVGAGVSGGSGGPTAGSVGSGGLPGL